jgi:RNase P subunit RPR2
MAEVYTYYPPFSIDAPNMSKLPIPVVTKQELLSAITSQVLHRTVLPANVLKKFKPRKRKEEFMNDIETEVIKRYSNRGKYNITVTNKGYQCNLCQKIYQDLSYVMFHQKNHESINSGVRNFVCQHCGVAYFYKKHLVQHIRLRHKK